MTIIHMKRNIILSKNGINVANCPFPQAPNRFRKTQGTTSALSSPHFMWV